MGSIAAKYQVGDVVFYADAHMVQKQLPCPDCLGSGKWQAISPGGMGYLIPCPRCSARFHSNHELSLTYNAYEASVVTRTIGSVRYDSASDNPFQYMCRETGVGSGILYNEDSLHATREEAEIAARAIAVRQDRHIETEGKKYHGLLEVCDYQLDLAGTKAMERRIFDLRWDMDELCNQVAEALTEGEPVVPVVVRWLDAHNRNIEDASPGARAALSKAGE